MKVLFTIYSLGLGGAERVAATLANRFADDGDSVVMALQTRVEKEYPLDPKVKVLVTGLSEEEEKKSRVVKPLLRVRKLRRALDDEKPDVVIAFMKKSIYHAILARGSRKIPIVASVRNDPRKFYCERMDPFFIRTLMPKADWTVFQTQDEQSFFPEAVQKKSSVIVNPVHPKYLHLPKAARTKRVVNVGRIVEQKNQLLLVDAFSIFSKTHPDFTLTIYGADGPDPEDHTPEKLQARIRELGLAEKVSLPGNSAHLERDLPDAAMFVLSSDYEGMPNALMEAMAMGIPVISTDCPAGGPKMLIRDGKNGLLTPVGDAAALAEKMSYLADHPQDAERMGDEARKIEEIADPEQVYQAWRGVAESVT